MGVLSAETLLSPTPQSFRQCFPHFIPGTDDIMPSALPKLEEVLYSSGTCRYPQRHANLDYPAFVFVQNGRGFAGFSPHGP